MRCPEICFDVSRCVSHRRHHRARERRRQPERTPWSGRCCRHLPDRGIRARRSSARPALAARCSPMRLLVLDQLLNGDRCDNRSDRRVIVAAQPIPGQFERFGKGRHPAALNLGDCFAYACAVTRDMPAAVSGERLSADGHRDRLSAQPDRRSGPSPGTSHDAHALVFSTPTLYHHDPAPGGQTPGAFS